MTDLEKAIQEFEDNAYHESKKPEISVDSKVIALKSLQEKLEREKGCKMCNSNDLKGYFINSDSYGMSIARRIQSDYISLSYCPNCGRKLKEDY